MSYGMFMLKAILASKRSADRDIATLLGHKRAADHELCTFVQSRADALPPATRSAVLQQLDHLLAVDRIFRAHISGRPHGLASTVLSPAPDADETAAGIGAEDAWFDSYLAAASPADLDQPVRFVFTDGRTGTLTRAEMLIHVATHAAYHRGAAWALLRQAVPTPASLTLAGWLHGIEPARRGPGGARAATRGPHGPEW